MLVALVKTDDETLLARTRRSHRPFAQPRRLGRQPLKPILLRALEHLVDRLVAIAAFRRLASHAAPAQDRERRAEGEATTRDQDDGEQEGGEEQPARLRRQTD